jgi:REP element-mobilizing transposase RayT
MWNDTDFPLAVFFTFRCHGTWLHGDERGSVDRHQNIYGTPRLPNNPNWKTFSRKKLEHPAVILNAAQRRAVEEAVRDTCEKRQWDLIALNARTNHVHAVIDIGTMDAERALNALKANATRQLRETGLWKFAHSPWVKRGSRRKLWNERSVVEASDYVLNRQGDEPRNE